MEKYFKLAILVQLLTLKTLKIICYLHLLQYVLP
jgi:hypothetical protein